MVRALHGGAKNADARNGDVSNAARFHPTQKPVCVMEASVSVFPKARTILDPYMGSGSTGLACIKTGRQFIGIELEKKYFDIACERIRKAWKLERSKLRFEPEPRMVQRELITA
ncbi:MAG: site-specific DNA-methyltransferase [Desulfurellales bacterium]|nr:MAG: site-specific DNA-methyltransferase [Desulfurellales bacterium]